MVFDRSSRKDGESVQKVVKKVLNSAQERTVKKITKCVGEIWRIRNDPPFLVRLS